MVSVSPVRFVELQGLLLCLILVLGNEGTYVLHWRFVDPFDEDLGSAEDVVSECRHPTLG